MTANDATLPWEVQAASFSARHKRALIAIKGEETMSITRRTLVGAGATVVLPRQRARAQAGPKSPTLRIGVLTDVSGTYRDVAGPTSIACVRQAVQEFTAGMNLNVDVLTADHQNKPNVGAAIARQWFDRDGVDMVVDINNSALALAVSGIGREKNKVILPAAATSELTGLQCSPNTVHWSYDTYMLARSTATSTLKVGGDTWFFITPDYAFGHQLARDATRFVTGAGDKVLGNAIYPFPETTDFSAYLNQAQASGAKVLGLCNGGGDAVNSIKQAHEFGIQRRMRLAAMAVYVNIVHALGLETAGGLLLTESFYWDLNDRTRAFLDRVRPKTPNNWPNMLQAGDYAATLHYLKAVADIGIAAAKTDGRAVVARMKAMPTDDDCFGKGYIREDGRKIHPSYLFQVKSPTESKQDWDLYKLVATTPGDQAFRSLTEGGCPLHA